MLQLRIAISFFFLLWFSQASIGQCDLVFPSPIFNNPIELTADGSSGDSGNFIVCDGTDYTLTNNGINEVWMGNGSSLVYDGNGFGLIFAINNSFVDYQGNGIGTVIVTPGSTVVITDGAHTVYVQCGGTVIVETMGSSLDIFYECEEDIVLTQNMSNNFQPVFCPEITIDFPDAPGPILDIGGCEALEPQDYPYTIDASAFPGPCTWSTGETTPSITVNGPGSYNVEVPSICGTGTATLELLEANDVELEIQVQGVLCGNSYPFDLEAPEGLDSYLWSNGSTESSIEVDAGGTYTVEVPDGCGLVTLEITLPDVLPTIPVVDLGPDVGLCGYQFPEVINAPGPADSFLWNTGETTQSIEIDGPGTYEVTATNVCGSDSDEITITQINEGLDLDFGEPEDYCGIPFPITLDAGPGFDLYQWSTGETTQSIVVTEPGEISAYAEQFQCFVEVDEEIYIGGAFPENPEIELNIDEGNCSIEWPVTLEIPGEYDTYNWSTGQSTASIEINIEGIYELEVTNICGSATYTFDITSNITPPELDWGTDQSFCDAIFPINLDPGAVWDSYLWDGGETDQILVITGPGT